jgi:hypothetical protein
VIAAVPLRRQQNSTWALEEPALIVAANAGAVRTKLLTQPWEALYELGRDDLPRQVPDLRRAIPAPPRTLVVRVRRRGLVWPEWQYFGLVDVPEQAPVEEAEIPEADPLPDPEETSA